MDSANRLEAVSESLEDEAQGADILMVKPALAYLDIIRDLCEATRLPICAYNGSVTGISASQRKWLEKPPPRKYS